MHTLGSPLTWAVFLAFLLLALSVDLLALKRQGARAVSTQEALIWSLSWVALSLAFACALWFWALAHGGETVARQKVGEFLTGYVIEKSLSADNIFVFLLVFQRFAVPQELQKKALVLGVIGAMLLRGLMILAGSVILSYFHGLLYVFGAFLLYTGLSMLLQPQRQSRIDDNPLLRGMRRWLPLCPDYLGNRLTYREHGQRWYTPLFVVVCLIGVLDVVFAVDSIPATFAVTTDPFIVMSSNLFAVLGLRALFFLLANMAQRFHYLKHGLAVVLLFIGLKMLLQHWLALPIATVLGIVMLILATSVASSVLRSKN